MAVNQVNSEQKYAKKTSKLSSREDDCKETKGNCDNKANMYHSQTAGAL